MTRHSSSLSSSRVIAIVFLLSTALGLARWTTMPSDGFGSPNTSDNIAKSLVQTGRYVGTGAARLWGEASPKAMLPLRAFHHPAEPLYLAAWMKYAPGLLTLAHLPVLIAAILGVTYMGLVVGGNRIGLLTGILACLHPFFAVHGLTFDDTFLSAALEWGVLALLLMALSKAQSGRGTGATFHWVSALAAGVLAGAAAVTRLQGLLFLGAVCLVILVWPRLRRVRLHAVLILLFMGMSLGAWGMRNKAVLGHFLIGTTHDGITLWEANYPSAREALVRFGTVEPLDQERMIDDFARTQTLDEYQANQYFTQRGTRYILEHPGDVALTAGLKVFVSLTGYAFHFRLLSIRNLVALSYNPPFIVVGIIGLAILWRRCRGSDVQLLFTVTMAAALAVTTLLLVTGSCGYRYRLGIDDFLLIGAAVVVDRLLGRRRTGGEDSQRQSEKEYVHSGIA